MKRGCLRPSTGPVSGDRSLRSVPLRHLRQGAFESRLLLRRAVIVISLGSGGMGRVFRGSGGRCRAIFPRCRDGGISGDVVRDAVRRRRKRAVRCSATAARCGSARPGRGVVRNAGEGPGVFLPANVSGFVSVWVGGTERNGDDVSVPPPVRNGSARPIRFPAGCTRTRPTFRRPSPGGFGKAVSCIGSVRPRREGRGKDFGPGLRKRIAPAGKVSCGGETSYRVRTSARTAGFSVPAVRPSSVPDRRPKRSRCTVRPQRSVLRRI